MKDNSQIARFSLRRILIFGSAFVVLCALSVPYGLELRRDLHLKRTLEAIDSPNPSDAIVSANFLIDAFPDDPEAARLYLQAYRRADKLPPESLRKRFSDMFSANEPIVVELALLEFQSGLFAEAEERLSRNVLTQGSIDGVKLGMMIALARQDVDSAEAWAIRLLKLSDATARDELAAARILLSSNSTYHRNAAKQRLLLLSGGEMAFDALVELLHFKEEPGLVKAALESLANSQDLTAEQRFRQLDIMAQFGAEDLQSALIAAQSTMRSRDHVARLIGWMNAHGFIGEAMDWSAELPVSILGDEQVSFALAESYLYAGDRSGLYNHLIDKSWLRGECIRLALIALCMEDSRRQQHFWDRSISVAKRNGQTSQLKQVLANWGIEHPAIQS